MENVLQAVKGGVNLGSNRELEIRVVKYVLSQKERFLVDLRLSGKSYAEIAAAYLERYKKVVKGDSIKLWLSREHVREEIFRELEKRSKVDGFDERQWKLVGVEVVDGVRKLDGMQGFVWKELGRAGGYYRDGVGGGRDMNVQINFKQGDGRE